MSNNGFKVQYYPPKCKDEPKNLYFEQQKMLLLTFYLWTMIPTNVRQYLNHRNITNSIHHLASKL